MLQSRSISPIQSVSSGVTSPTPTSTTTKPCRSRWFIPASKTLAFTHAQTSADLLALRFPMTFSRRERLDRRSLAKTRRRRTRKVLSATSPIQALTCVTRASSNPLDARPRQRVILRYHADDSANIGQRAFSSKASTVRACYQWSAYPNGSISSLSAKLAHVRYFSSLSFT